MIEVRNEDDRVTVIETLERLDRIEKRIGHNTTDLDLISRSVRAYQNLCTRIKDLKVDRALQDRIDRVVSHSERMTSNLCNSIERLETESSTTLRERISRHHKSSSLLPPQKKSILLHGSGLSS
jgi:hypothetical protein